MNVLTSVIAYLVNLIIVSEGVHFNYLFPRVDYEYCKRDDFEVNQSILLDAVNFGWDGLQRQQQFEDNLNISPIQIENDGVSIGLLIDGKPSAVQINDDQIAQAIIKSTKYLMDVRCAFNGIGDKECIKNVYGIRQPESVLLDQCTASNAVLNKLDLTAYRRLFSPNYKDGLNKVHKRSLPLPRDVAETLYYANQKDLHQTNTINRTSEGVLDKKRNVFLAAFTQFIEQDLSKTLIRTMKNGKGIECCDNFYYKAAPRYTHPACMPLEVQADDQFYHEKSITCLNYVRSALHSSCVFGPVQQANGATSAFDLSQLYGISGESMTHLRKGEGGLLKSCHTDENQFLTQNSPTHCLKYKNRNSTFCYKAGDIRVNANPYVTIIYTLFLRLHNRLATKYADQHPEWSDNHIFFKAREVTIAIYQKIVYEEWAKVFLGRENLSALKQKLTLYDNVNGVSNEFATAAIRVYHSLLPGDLRLEGQCVLKLEDIFYRPINLKTNNYFNQILQALFNQRTMAMDSGYVDDLSNHYYQSPSVEFGQVGSDAMALDINRGRDHGLSAYVKYLSHCINRNISEWNDLVGILRAADLRSIKQIYSSPKDIDLLVGLLAELPDTDATVGPTAICIIGEQLLNSKKYDSTFYTKNAELCDEVRHMTAAKLICQTTELRYVPTKIFNIPNDENGEIDCDQL